VGGVKTQQKLFPGKGHPALNIPISITKIRKTKKHNIFDDNISSVVDPEPTILK
jgi:hypothetical protein